MITMEQVRAAKDKLVELLGNPPEMTTGIGKEDGEFVVKASFSTAPAAGLVPAEVDGVKVSTEVVGDVVALQE